MLPLFMRLYVKNQHGKSVNLWLPLFFVWLLLLPFFIVLLPLLLIAEIIMPFTRYPVSPCRIMWYAGSLLSHLRGLKVKVKSRNNHSDVYISIA
jgi:hypothetical protein